MSELPEEIWAQIFSLLHHDDHYSFQPDLCACALVSTVWNARVSPILWRILRIEWLPATESRLVDTLKRHPELVSVVQTVHFVLPTFQAWISANHSKLCKAYHQHRWRTFRAALLEEFLSRPDASVQRSKDYSLGLYDGYKHFYRFDEIPADLSFFALRSVVRSGQAEWFGEMNEPGYAQSGEGRQAGLRKLWSLLCQFPRLRVLWVDIHPGDATEDLPPLHSVEVLHVPELILDARVELHTSRVSRIVALAPNAVTLRMDLEINDRLPAPRVPSAIPMPPRLNALRIHSSNSQDSFPPLLFQILASAPTITNLFLECEFQADAQTGYAIYAAALSSLVNLESLTLQDATRAADLPGSIVAVVISLPRLRHLEVFFFPTPALLQTLATNLLSLTVGLDPHHRHLDVDGPFNLAQSALHLKQSALSTLERLVFRNMHARLPVPSRMLRDLHPFDDPPSMATEEQFEAVRVSCEEVGLSVHIVA